METDYTVNIYTNYHNYLFRATVLHVHPPPEMRTLSELMATVLTMAWCPEKFCMKLPSGNFHTLTLSGAPEAKQNLLERKITKQK